MKSTQEIKEEAILILKNEALEQIKKYEEIIKQELLQNIEAKKFLIHHVNNNEKLENLLNEKDYFNAFNHLYTTRLTLRTKFILNEIEQHYSISYETNKERKTISIYLNLKESN
jgi:hypothetical protein